MSTPDVMGRVFEVIERHIADARAQEALLPTRQVIEAVRDNCADCGLSERQIEDLIIELAAREGVAVAFGASEAWHKVP
jgi:hypothetical protein